MPFGQYHAVVELNVGLAAPADHNISKAGLLQPDRVGEAAPWAINFDLELIDVNVASKLI